MRQAGYRSMHGELAGKIIGGDVRAAASLISWIEDRDPRAKPALKALYPHTGRAHIVGITGAAGTGKSSLIDRLIAAYRRRRKTVGVLAVDPTSRFSGGALLGDRLRMRGHFLDRKVFVRSLATRGSAGGLADAVRDAAHVLDALGKELILVETIGVGQDELDIAALAHTVAVVLNPQSGDEVQALKAGLGEIADVVAVNKADLPGANMTVEQLRGLVGNGDLPIVAVSALRDENIGALVDEIDRHRHRSLTNGDHQRKQRQLCRQELVSLLQQRWIARLEKNHGADALDKAVEQIVERRTDPYSAAEALARKLGL